MPVKAKKRKARQTVRVAWRKGRRQPVRAAVAKVALDAIAKRHRGGITPRAVVDAARDPVHPLHPCFTWEDSIAAERWREQQARLIINAIEVVHADDTPPRVCYVSVGYEDERAYRASATVMSDAEMRQQALAEALAALEGWQRRYAHLTELADVFEAAGRTKARHLKGAASA